MVATLLEICTPSPKEVAAAFHEVRIMEAGIWGFSVEEVPMLRHGPFKYGSSNDRLFELEYPDGFVDQYAKPYHCKVCNGEVVCDDPRVEVDHRVRVETFERACTYAKSIGKPIKGWDCTAFCWIDMPVEGFSMEQVSRIVGEASVIKEVAP